VFEIASITKVFTALLLANMVGHGEMGLDDPVAVRVSAVCSITMIARRDQSAERWDNAGLVRTKADRVIEERIRLLEGRPSRPLARRDDEHVRL
jgi:hypothetical protein